MERTGAENAITLGAGGRKDGPVVVSGYYGFGNLGDEAILEVLVGDLKRLVPADSIVVLSAAPERTARLYGVRAAGRLDGGVISLLSRAQLLVSGGGGLFQDTRSIGSCLYYGGTIALAALLGGRSLVYAQGLGPLSSFAAREVTKRCLSLCAAVSVRDDRSKELLSGWGIESVRTADPVWCLEPSPLPEPVSRALSEIRKESDAPLVGVSLRSFSAFTAAHLADFEQALADGLPPDARLITLPLQSDQDGAVLLELCGRWRKRGRVAYELDIEQLTLPSQWLPVMERLDLLVGMRLHAQILALMRAVPVAGLAYDPKVERLLTDFAQPILNLANPDRLSAWTGAIEVAYSRRRELSATAAAAAEGAKKLACQNFDLLARILGMQSAP